MNYKIAIDPGHGGEDTGNRGNGIVEKDYALLISNYIKKRLDDLGVDNVITRNTDRNLTISERVNIIERYYGNEDNVIVLSNHLNSNGDGLEIIYALRNNDVLSSKIANSVTLAGGVVNKYYQLRDPKNTNLDYYELLRDTPNYQTIMIEYANVNNSVDADRIKNNYQNYAEAVVQGLANYIGVKYIPLPDSNYYVVKKGDTLYKIASIYNVSVDEIKKANGLISNNLDIGQILYIPVEDEPKEENVYIVKSGDTLYKIASIYNVSVDGIKNANELISNTLQIGQKLVIPSKSSSEIIYIVKSGDSLYKIANLYGISVDELKSFNGLTSNILQIGQKLVIPSGEKTIYIVKSGDTLYKIASVYNTTVDKIKKDNNLVTNTLQIGQSLIIS